MHVYSCLFEKKLSFAFVSKVFSFFFFFIIFPFYYENWVGRGGKAEGGKKIFTGYISFLPLFAIQ